MVVLPKLPGMSVHCATPAPGANSYHQFVQKPVSLDGEKSGPFPNTESHLANNLVSQHGVVPCFIEVRNRQFVV